jgi:hypothetical protein
MAAITDLATASAAGDSDYLVVNQSGTDRKMTRTMLGFTGTGRVATGSYVLTVGNTSAINGSCVGNITGSGTIATGGFTLTVPATGTAALRGVAQSFTEIQTVDVSAAGNLLVLAKGGSDRFKFLGLTAAAVLEMTGGDNGASYGNYISIQRNINASTPAAGFIYMYDKSGTAYAIWPDDSGVLRINNADPTFANDAAGARVGEQTSSLDAKHIVGAPLDIADVLVAVQAGADAVRRFTYRSGAYGGEEFSGVVTDFAPRYGMDCDEAHPAGRSLNLITVVGDLLMAVANLTERVAGLEGESAA